MAEKPRLKSRTAREINPANSGVGVPLPKPSVSEPFRFLRETSENVEKTISDFRPLSWRNPVVIGSSSLGGRKMRYGGVYYYLPNTEAVWDVLYQNTTPAPQVFDYRQEINGTVDEEERKRISGNATLEVKTRKEITSPLKAECKAKCGIPVKTYDSVSKSYDIGLLDYSEKPVEDYPEDEASGNGTGWSRWDPIQEDDILSVSVEDRIYNTQKVEGTHYREPGENMRVKWNTRLTNESGGTAAFMSIAGLVCVNVYEDDDHWSRVHNWSGRTWRKVGDGVTVSRTRSITVPGWMHGEVCVWNSVSVVLFGGPMNEYVTRKTYKVGDMIPP